MRWRLAAVAAMLGAMGCAKTEPARPPPPTVVTTADMHPRILGTVTEVEASFRRCMAAASTSAGELAASARGDSAATCGVWARQAERFYDCGRALPEMSTPGFELFTSKEAKLLKLADEAPGSDLEEAAAALRAKRRLDVERWLPRLYLEAATKAAPLYTRSLCTAGSDPLHALAVTRLAKMEARVGKEEIRRILREAAP